MAGISIGTVDRVLHNRGRVSAESAAAINAIIASRGYRPNLFASRLAGGMSVRTIGVLLPRLDQDFGYWRLIWNGMLRAAKELEPLQVTIQRREFDRYVPSTGGQAFLELAADNPDALVLAPIHSRVFRPLVEDLPASLPILFVDGDLECLHAKCFLGQDPWEGGALAAKLLGLSVEAGRPVVLVRFEEEDEHLQKRSDGFTAFVAASGRQLLILKQKLSDPLSHRRAELSLFLARHPLVGGLFVPNASVADYAQTRLNCRVVGYELIDENIAALRTGRLDVLLSQRPEMVGYEAVRRVSRMLLFQEALPPRILLPLDVVVKENLEGHLHSLELEPSNTPQT